MEDIVHGLLILAVRLRNAGIVGIGLAKERLCTEVEVKFLLPRQGRPPSVAAGPEGMLPISFLEAIISFEGDRDLLLLWWWCCEVGSLDRYPSLLLTL